MIFVFHDACKTGMEAHIYMYHLRRADLRAPFLAGIVLILTLAGAGPASAVTGGTDVADDGLPFVAKLAMGNTQRACTGVLVDPRAVLTAKACFADANGAVPTGAPTLETNVTVGRSGTSGGVTTKVTEVIGHPARDLAIGRLATPVVSVAPIGISATAPAGGDELTLAGFGRTADEWVPDRLKSASFKIDAVEAATFDVVPAGSDPVGLCRGDAGGPALRRSGEQFQLVALHHASNEAGCLGEEAGAPRATETRVDDVRSWVMANLPGFATGMDTGEVLPNWPSAGDSAVPSGSILANVGGVCCSLTGPELLVGSVPGGSHSGTHGLLFSGKDTSSTRSFAYLRSFDLGGLPVRPGTTLSYWIYPQSNATSFGYAEGGNSTCVAVDLLYINGGHLRDSGVNDQRGNRAHPAGQCGKLTLDAWNEVIVPIGSVAAGKRIATLTVGYDQPANTGGYRGFIDDIMVSDDKFATGAESGQPGLTWTNSVSTEAPGGGLFNVGGVCCGLTGPELFPGRVPEGAHGGTSAVLYSGKDNSADRSFAYTKAFQLSDVYVTSTTRLSYWIYPESKSTSFGHAEGSNSMCTAIDLIFVNPVSGARQNLRDSGAVDQRGNLAHPAKQCGKLTLDTWNHVSVPLGGVANGKRISQLDIGYDQGANTGGYRGFIDDIRISQ